MHLLEMQHSMQAAEVQGQYMFVLGSAWLEPEKALMDNFCDFFCIDTSYLLSI